MQPANLRQDISSRDQYNQLTHDRYDHAEYCFAECLEYGTGNDTEPCDQVVDTDAKRPVSPSLQLLLLSAPMALLLGRCIVPALQDNSSN